MRRTLILYATREGQTQKIAAAIAERLESANQSVALIDASDPTSVSEINFDDFELLVFGGSMHAGGVESELVAFLNRHRTQIESKPRSFFLVLLSAATRDPALRARWLADANSKVAAQIKVAFDDTEMIAGALTYSKYAWPLRWMMQRIARKAGGDTDTSRDYEYTDWNQVASYADRLASR